MPASACSGVLEACRKYSRTVSSHTSLTTCLTTAAVRANASPPCGPSNTVSATTHAVRTRQPLERASFVSGTTRSSAVSSPHLQALQPIRQLARREGRVGHVVDLLGCAGRGRRLVGSFVVDPVPQDLEKGVTAVAPAGRASSSGPDGRRRGLIVASS